MIPDPAARERARAERAAQGLPPQIEDPAIIRQVAIIIIMARRERAKKEALEGG